MGNQDRTFLFLDLGTVDYNEAFAFQKRLVEGRARGRRKDTFILLEHPPVFTISRRTNPEHLLVPPSILQEKGISLCETNRGGDVTYHGPGQLVGYVIMDLQSLGRDLHRYVRSLEQVVIDTLSDWGIEASRLTEHPGVWVKGEKIAAIGIAVDRRWITMHGFSLNVDPRLDHYSYIVPCGIRNKGVTSMKKILGKEVDGSKLRSDVLRHFGRIFAAAMEKAEPEDLSW